MKIYITGSVGSGKSTYAERLSQVTGIECTHLDEIVYEQAGITPLNIRIITK